LPQENETTNAVDVNSAPTHQELLTTEHVTINNNQPEPQHRWNPDGIRRLWDALGLNYAQNQPPTGLAVNEELQLDKIAVLPAQVWLEICRWATEGNFLDWGERDLARRLGEMRNQGELPIPQRRHGKRILDKVQLRFETQ
jgi:hypothetical protein